ncbi:MAG: small ribosomal subunit Rsm22 family protein [bacterium]
MIYPRELESWWLAAACRSTDCDDHVVALQCLEAAAAGLSDQFTIERPLAFKDYTGSPVLLAAYGILFFPQTFARVSIALRECLAAHAISTADSRSLPISDSFRVLDLGSGAGASSLAVMTGLRRPLSLHAVDHAPAALAALQSIFSDCRQLWPAATLTTHVRDVRTDGLPGTFDLILASFVMNELFAEHESQRADNWLRQQLDRLAPGGCLIVLEPAGAATCERLQRMRDKLACNDNFSLVAPCPHRLPCPMRAAKTGFCHDVRRWCVPESVNLINRRLFRSVHDLKYGMLVVRRAPIDSIPESAENQETETKNQECHPPPATIMRLVAPVYRIKGRILMQGCCSDGSLRAIEWPTRHLTREQLDTLMAKERGDILPLGHVRLLGDGKTWRVENFIGNSGRQE